jgi:Right handed beta helix region
VSGNLEGGIIANVSGFGIGLQVTITDCTISGNSRFGGIHAEGAPNLTVTNSTISGNSANAGFPAGDRGGGISGQAGISVENCTISGNSAGTSGGGIYEFAVSLHVTIARSPATRHLLAEAFITSGALLVTVSLRSPT